MCHRRMHLSKSNKVTFHASFWSVLVRSKCILSLSQIEGTFHLEMVYSSQAILHLIYEHTYFRNINLLTIQFIPNWQMTQIFKKLLIDMSRHKETDLFCDKTICMLIMDVIYLIGIEKCVHCCVVLKLVAFTGLLVPSSSISPPPPPHCACCVYAQLSKQKGHQFCRNKGILYF